MLRVAVRRTHLLPLSAMRSFADHSASTWSAHQAKRQEQMKGPRFIGVDLSAQPLPKPAIDLIAQEPIMETTSRIVACDGGHAGLGHPRVFINLDSHKPATCLYCGKQYVLKEGHHHHH